MMKFKRLTAAATAVALSLSMMSFTGAPSESEQFDDFLDSLPATMMSSSNVSVNFNFNNPESFGFETTTLQLPFASSRTLLQQGETEYNTLLTALQKYDYNKLTKPQQITYDTLEDYLEYRKALVPYSYQDNSYLGGYLSAQANLPMYLLSFSFNRKQDLDSYFNLLETAKETFVQYAENELLRQEKGVGLTPAIMEDAIEQCNNFIENSTDYLIESFNERIDAASFLTALEKQSAKAKNKKLVQNDLVNAYRTLKRELMSITVKTPDGGLAKQSDGKAYYEKLVQEKVGTDDSIEQIQLLLTKTMTESYLKILRASIANKDAERYTDANGKPMYTDLQSASELISYLYNACKADFPEVNFPNYRLEQVPDSMSANYSPASYKTPKVDANPTDPQIIRLNGAFDQSDYLTVAHESFPGHMYQYTYYQTLDLPAIRSLTEFAGSAEGWATYVEDYALRYVPEQYRPYAEILRYNQLYTNCVIGLLDIGIHYEGWTREQACEFLQKRISKDITLETANAQYDMHLESPGNYLAYYLGGLYFKEMRTQAEEALGSDFDVVEFHQTLLNAGNTSFPIYQKQVNQYIAEKQAANKAA